eukprot:scaffold667060_cov59-Prasinocladus_malaysianus.AAC.1
MLSAVQCPEITRFLPACLICGALLRRTYLVLSRCWSEDVSRPSGHIYCGASYIISALDACQAPNVSLAVIIKDVTCCCVV